MKKLFAIVAFLITTANLLSAQNVNSTNHLYMDVHRLEPGKVKPQDVAEVHKKDLAIQKKYGVSFIKYWVDEKNGLVYCLSSAPSAEAIKNTHAEAHGLMPETIYEVIAGEESAGIQPENLFLDIHYLGEGKVTAQDVVEAHKKDLAVQGKNEVRFVNYWVAEKEGVVFCLSQANNPEAIIRTHSEAHGLAPASVASVVEGK